MFGKITEQLAGIRVEVRAVQTVLKALASSMDDSERYDGLRGRLDSLEGPLQAQLGEVEGLLAKAKSLKDAARSAEARERGHAQRAERLASELDEGDENGAPARGLSDEDIAYLQRLDAERREEAGLQTMPTVLDALRARKFGPS